MAKLTDLLVGVGQSSFFGLTEEYIAKDWSEVSFFHPICSICERGILVVFTSKTSPSKPRCYLSAYCEKCNLVIDSTSMSSQLFDSIQLHLKSLEFSLESSDHTELKDSLEMLDLQRTKENNVSMPIVYEASSRKHVVPVLTLNEYFNQDFTLSIPPWQRE